ARHYFDASEWLSKIALEGNWLEAEEFLRLGQSLETIVAIRTFLSRTSDTYGALWELAQPVTVSLQLAGRISEKVDDKAQVRDSASSTLAQIRKRLREEQSRVRRLADQLFRQAVSDGYL